MLNWTLFGASAIVAYGFLSAFGQLGGGSGTSGFGAAMATFKPLPFVLLVLGNVAWSVAIYYGFQNTKFAIPAVIAVGVITSFLYSVLFLGSSATATKMFGVGVILLGVYLIR